MSTKAVASILSNVSIPSNMNIQPLLDADKGGATVQICMAADKLEKEYNLTLQQIEKIFRDNNCSSYLVAKRWKDVAPEDVEIILPEYASSAKETYWVYVAIAKNHEDAMKEILLESSSYEENFNKLNLIAVRKKASNT